MLSLRGSGQFLVLAGLWHGQKVGVVVWGPPAFPTTSESKNRHLAGLGQLDDLAQPQRLGCGTGKPSASALGGHG